MKGVPALKRFLGRIGRRGDGAAAGGSIVVEGARKSGGGRSRSRVIMAMGVFFALYGLIGGRLVYL
ncbi:MAG: penicillin-binding protein 2, partial [Nitratireductor sp.]